MPGENLTRDEATTRAGVLALDAYLIDIDLREVASSPTFTTTTEVTFEASEGARTFIDVIAERTRLLTHEFLSRISAPGTHW
jgi:aminopeptidase N